MKKRYITLFSVLIGTVACMAQTTNDTINRMVLVESTYNPIITGAVKRNFIPEAAKPTMNKEQIIYADEGIDLTYFDRKANPAPTVAIMPKKSTPGYAHIGYGNYNNLSGLAAYKFRFNENGDLAIHTHIDGWNGDLKLSNDTEWRSQFYDMGLRADCNIRLGNATFNAGTHTARYSYNYLAASIPDDKEDAPQHADKIGVYIENSQLRSNRSGILPPLEYKTSRFLPLPGSDLQTQIVPCHALQNECSEDQCRRCDLHVYFC